MSANLFELSKNVLTPELISKIAGFTGEEQVKIKPAIEMTLPAVVGALSGKVSNEKGSSEIMKLIRDGGYDGNILKNPESAFSDSEKLNAVITNASGTVSFLFGNKIKELKSYISKENNIDPKSASSLTGILTAVVMSLTGKQLLADNLNSKGLATFLSGQRNFLTGLVPAGISGILGFKYLNRSHLPGDQFKQYSQDIDSPAKVKFKPWLLIAICAALLYLLWRSCSVDKPPVTKKSGIEKTDSLNKISKVYADPPKTGDPLMDSITGTIGKFITKTLPDGTEIIIAENGVEAMLIDFIEDKNKTADKETWFSFDRILFEINKSTLRPSSDYEVKNIVAIMKAYPDIEIKIGGYTDNTGDENSNLRLSQERAYAVRSALIEKGVEE
jgi:outer membrane protein OmpA-like peptidoglycan-associated protein